MILLLDEFFSLDLQLQAFVSLENENNFTATVSLIFLCPSNVYKPWFPYQVLFQLSDIMFIIIISLYNTQRTYSFY